MKKPKFKNGQSVFLEFSNGDIQGPYIVKSSYFQSLTRIYMYSFEETSICVGEIYLKDKKKDKKLSYSECIHDNNENKHSAFSALDDFLATDGRVLADGVTTITNNLDLMFFRPDNNFIKWLVEYANGRIIVDVGCGTGWITQSIVNEGGKAIGIDSRFNNEDGIKINIRRLKYQQNTINFISDKIENQSKLLQALGSKGLIIFCRPSHGNFVENCIKIKHKDTEVLYITIPENLEKYNDLGIFKSKAIKITHSGTSVDNEVVLSMK